MAKRRSPASVGRPSFDDLPFRKDDPPFSAWGLWGPDDELGTLNLLTDDIVAAAARQEIKTGVRISLDWPLDKLTTPSFGRQPFHQELVKKPNKVANDDVITFNTQSSSQWDGLRHFAYQNEQLFYNGKTNDDFHSTEASTVNGIHVMANRGGLCGRGVLIDFFSYTQDQNIPCDALAHHSISLSDLLAVAKHQGVIFTPGDILFIRSGFTVKYESMSEAERVQMGRSPPSFTGVETSPETARWIWENQFSAVAGDAPSWEAWPAKQSPSLHEILLAGWGCPIGELFDLEELAAHCKRVKRWSFFLASIPLKNPGGAASPSNAVAIF